MFLVRSLQSAKCKNEANSEEIAKVKWKKNKKNSYKIKEEKANFGIWSVIAKVRVDFMVKNSKSKADGKIEKDEL